MSAEHTYQIGDRVALSTGRLADTAAEAQPLGTVSIDHVARAAYIRLSRASEGAPVHRTIPVECNLDIAANGLVIGVEVLDWPVEFPSAAVPAAVPSPEPPAEAAACANCGLDPTCEALCKCGHAYSRHFPEFSGACKDCMQRCEWFDPSPSPSLSQEPGEHDPLIEKHTARLREAILAAGPYEPPQPPPGHDPLCEPGLRLFVRHPMHDGDDGMDWTGCQCALIARVVERERGKADQRVADALEAAAKRVADEVPAAFAFESDPDKVIALIVAAVAAARPAEGTPE